MLKTILITVATVVIAALIYVGWVLSQAMSDVEREISSSYEITGSRIILVAVLSGTDKAYQVTDITFPRRWGEEMGVKPPSGFSVKQYSLDGREDQDASEWVNAANERLIRWVGSRDLIPGESTVFEFPIDSKIVGSGTLSFSYERKIGMSGSLSSFNKEIAVGET